MMLNGLSKSNSLMCDSDIFWALFPIFCHFILIHSVDSFPVNSEKSDWMVALELAGVADANGNCIDSNNGDGDDDVYAASAAPIRYYCYDYCDYNNMCVVKDNYILMLR